MANVPWWVSAMPPGRQKCQLGCPVNCRGAGFHLNIGVKSFPVVNKTGAKQRFTPTRGQNSKA